MSRESDNERLVIRLQNATGLKVDGWAGDDTHNALTDLFLRARITRPTADSDVLALVTPDLVSEMFGASAVTRRNIEQHLPAVKAALREAGLTDAPMVLMALATIRAETAGFEPISEGKSRYNTAPGGEPFALYGPETRIGKVLGNTQPGDGAQFKGRGFVQLTGRDNYDRIGKRLGLELALFPDLANRADVAASILVEFLRAKVALIRAALAAGDLRKARKIINGGSHGLAAFEAAYRTGDRLLGDRRA